MALITRVVVEKLVGDSSEKRDARLAGFGWVLCPFCNQNFHGTPCTEGELCVCGAEIVEICPQQ